MPSTIKEIADCLGLSKPTVTAMVKSLDPEGEHTTEGKRGTLIIDDWLASLVADEFAKKGTIDPDRKQQMEQALETSKTKPQKPGISGVRRVALEMDHDSVKEAYERLLEAQKDKAAAESECRETKVRLEAKENEVRKLENDLADCKAKIKELEDKLDAERARYDALSSESIKALSAPKPGLFRRLFGKPKS